MNLPKRFLTSQQSRSSFILTLWFRIHRGGQEVQHPVTLLQYNYGKSRKSAFLYTHWKKRLQVSYMISHPWTPLTLPTGPRQLVGSWYSCQRRSGWDLLSPCPYVPFLEHLGQASIVRARANKPHGKYCSNGNLKVVQVIVAIFRGCINNGKVRIRSADEANHDSDWNSFPNCGFAIQHLKLQS